MASSKVEVEDAQLKHLGFLKILAINTVVLVTNLYDYAKQNSGPLKSTVGKVENASMAVVGPVCEKFKDFPSHLLVFLDRKVDEFSGKFDECAPPVAKTVASKAQIVLTKASLVVQDLAEEAKAAGPVAAITHAGAISKQVAVSQLALVWYKANQYPQLRGLSNTAVHVAANMSEKYNKMVKDMTARGFCFFNYVPLVPVEDMAKAYKQVEATAGGGKKEDGEAKKE